MLTKTEFEAQQQQFTALAKKLQTTNLLEDEKELLADLLQEHQERERLAWVHQKAERIVNVLFPTWRGGRIEEPKHPLWHDKSWWWNGATIDELSEQADGAVTVELSSYVGCGDTDRIYQLTLAAEWMHSDNPEELVKSYMQAQVDRAQRRASQEKLARAQADVVRAQAELKKLEGTHV